MLGRSVRVRPDRSGFWKLCGNDDSNIDRIRREVFVEDFFCLLRLPMWLDGLFAQVRSELPGSLWTSKQEF
jgi:hypothetical protein